MQTDNFSSDFLASKQIYHISLANDPALELFKDLNGTSQLHIQQQVIVLEGEKSILYAFRAGAKLLSIIGTPTFLMRLPKEIFLSSCAIHSIERNLLNQCVGFHLHQPLVALVQQPESVDIHGIPLPAIMLNGIVKSENVGAIARTAAAFGIPTLLCDSETSSPYLRRAVRVSLAAMFGLHIAEKLSIIDTLEYLQSRAYIVAVEQTPSASSLETTELPSNSLFVVGNEGIGISSEVLQKADTVVQIPLSSGRNVPSLNVAASVAIVLYSWQFQQNLKKTTQ